MTLTNLSQKKKLLFKCKKSLFFRLKIDEEKRFLLQQLKDSMRSVSTLESQLKLLSASTLSMSSSSSLGSLSSSYASSKGSYIQHALGGLQTDDPRRDCTRIVRGSTDGCGFIRGIKSPRSSV